MDKNYTGHYLLLSSSRKASLPRRCLFLWCEQSEAEELSTSVTSCQGSLSTINKIISENTITVKRWCQRQRLIHQRKVFDYKLHDRSDLSNRKGDNDSPRLFIQTSDPGYYCRVANGREQEKEDALIVDSELISIAGKCFFFSFVLLGTVIREKREERENRASNRCYPSTAYIMPIGLNELVCCLRAWLVENREESNIEKRTTLHISLSHPYFDYIWFDQGRKTSGISR